MINKRDSIMFDVQVLDLKDALKRIKPYVSKTSTLPILGGIKFTVTSNVLLTTTDLEKTMEFPIAAKVTRPGEFVLGLSFIEKIVKRLKADVISFTTKDKNKVSIESGAIKADLYTMPVKDFPTSPPWLTNHHATVEAFVLAKAAKVASIDETRPSLTGVLIERKGTSTNVVATDSYRLYLNSSDGQQRVKETKSILVGRSVIEAIAKDSKKATLTINTDFTLVQFVSSEHGGIVSARLIDGTFPKYEWLINQSADITWTTTLNSKTMITALDTVAIMTPKNLSVKINSADNGLAITGATAGIGSITEQVPAVVVGTVEESAFNAKYLADGFRLLDNPKVDSYGTTNPLIMSSGNERFLVMPIRIQ